MRTTIVGSLVIGLLAGPVVAHATPITLVFTGSDVSYSLNGQQATGDFTVEFHANTSNVQVEDILEHPVPIYHDLTATITFFDVGVGTFDDVYVFVNSNGDYGEAVGFGTEFIGDLYDLIANGQGLDTYGLTTDFGPISSTTLEGPFQWRDLPTSLGALSVFSVREGTFQAIVDEVPEPGTLALLGCGLLVMGFTRRRVG